MSFFYPLFSNPPPPPQADRTEVHFTKLALAEEETAPPLSSFNWSHLLPQMQIVLICQRTMNQAQRSNTAFHVIGTGNAQLRSCYPIPPEIPTSEPRVRLACVCPHSSCEFSKPFSFFPCPGWRSPLFLQKKMLHRKNEMPFIQMCFIHVTHYSVLIFHFYCTFYSCNYCTTL